MNLKQSILKAFDIYALTSADGLISEGCKKQQIIFYKHYENLVNTLCSKVVLTFSYSGSLSLCVYFKSNTAEKYRKLFFFFVLKLPLTSVKFSLRLQIQAS
jgi:hypothetical protein